jgi:hypothetical protein
MGCDLFEEDTHARARHQGRSCDTQGIAPLYHAVRNKDLLSRVLKQNALPVNAVIRGVPLIVLALCINVKHHLLVDILDLLIQCGADPLNKTFRGHTVLDVARAWHRPDAVCFLQQIEAQIADEQKLELLCRRRAMHAQYHRWGVDDTAPCLSSEVAGPLLCKIGVVNDIARMDPGTFAQLRSMLI